MLALVLSLSWLWGLTAVPSMHSAEIMALAQDSARLQNLSAAQTERLYESLLATRWRMWIETLAVFLATSITGVLAFAKWRYWPVLGMVVSVYVVWTSGAIFDSSYWHTLGTFIAIWPKGAIAFWYFYIVPLLYVLLAGAAAARIYLRRGATS